jgi:hypothetical protein
MDEGRRRCGEPYLVFMIGDNLSTFVWVLSCCKVLWKLSYAWGPVASIPPHQLYLKQKCMHVLQNANATWQR